jgi:8-oxo-dGTP diphosphatase
MPELSKEEQNKFYNSQPAKRIGASVWLENSIGRLLIAKPTYKAGWTLIGGIVEKDESPLDAAVRETREEIGIQLDKARFEFIGYRYVEPRDGRTEDTQVFFRARLTGDEIEAIKLQAEELSEYVFVAPADLPAYADTPRMQAVMAIARHEKYPFYMVNETCIL